MSDLDFDQVFQYSPVMHYDTGPLQNRDISSVPAPLPGSAVPTFVALKTMLCSSTDAPSTALCCASPRSLRFIATRDPGTQDL